MNTNLVHCRSRSSKQPTKPPPVRERRQSESFTQFTGLENPTRGRTGRRNSDPGTYEISSQRLQRLRHLEKGRTGAESGNPAKKVSFDKMVTKESSEIRMTRPQMLKTNTFTLGDISENDDGIKRRQSIGDDELDYRSEVDVGDFTASEIKVIVGRNRVRIIGERAFGSLEGSNGFHKVIQVPSNVDPMSLKSNLKDGKVVITGKYTHKNRKWTVNNRGLMTVKNDGCARITIDLPKGINPSQVQVKTITKHYLVISNSPNGDPPKSPCKSLSDNIAEDFIETFELPSDCDLNSLTKRTMGESTVVVEFGSQSPPTSKSEPSIGHRPRSFTF